MVGQLRKSDNKINGLARVLYEDGKNNLIIFEGEFIDGEPNGFGRIITNDGTCKEGIWVNANEGSHHDD